MSVYRLTKIAAISSALASVAATGAWAHNKDAVVDSQHHAEQHHHLVKDNRGNCVITKWSADPDPCAEPAPEPEPVVEAPKPTGPRLQLYRNQKTFYFDFDSAKLDAEAVETLNYLAERIKSSENVKRARVIGYADRIGSSAYNIRLSERRAQAVRSYLAQRGVVNAQVTEIRGLGESKSITDCKGSRLTKSLINCLRQDRRVEIELDYYR